MYSRSLLLFDDASFNELLFIQSVEAGVSLTKPPEAVTSPFSSKSDSLEEPTSSLTQVASLEDFPPLARQGSCPVMTSSPHSPCSAPAFSSPTLMKTLLIFSAKSPVSPTTLPLDSIRFENFTIRKQRKKPQGKPGPS